MLSLLYISRSRLSGSEAPLVLKDIMDSALRRNRGLNVTGALIFTGSEFAQALEGPEEGIHSVMASILIDTRHDDVSIVRQEQIARRSFPNWGMALIAHDAETASHIKRIRDAESEDALSYAVDMVMDWMRKGSAELAQSDTGHAEPES